MELSDWRNLNHKLSEMKIDQISLHSPHRTISAARCKEELEMVRNGVQRMEHSVIRRDETMSV